MNIHITIHKLVECATELAAEINEGRFDIMAANLLIIADRLCDTAGTCLSDEGVALNIWFDHKYNFKLLPITQTDSQLDVELARVIAAITAGG